MTAVDVYGCEHLGIIEVTEHTPPEPEIVGEALVCENETTALSLSQSFAAYLWSDGSTSATISGGAADYSVTVTDNNGCTGTDAASIDEIPLIAVYLAGDTLVCEGDIAILYLNMVNSSGPVTLWWNTPALQSPYTVFQDTSFLVPALQSMVIGLTDAEQAGYDCPFGLPDQVEIQTNKTGLSIHVPQPYNGFPVSCFGMADGTAEAQATEGIPPFNFSWSNQAFGPIAQSLSAGSYTVTITDFLGCEAVEQITLLQPPPITPLLYSEPPLCFDVNDGMIEVSGWSGGTGNVVVSLDHETPVDIPAWFEELPAGEQYLAFEDENGCVYDTSIVFPQPLQLFLELGEDITLELGDDVQLNPQMNFTPESFEWQPPLWLDDPFYLRPYSRPLEDFEYTLTAWNENDCVISDNIFLRVDKTLKVYTPNAFSPNGDGVNDGFTLFTKPTAVTAIRSLRVFDRWGELVFLKNDFLPNDPDIGWDGRLNGKPMNPAVFTWLAEVVMADGKVEQLAGDVTLMR